MNRRFKYWMQDSRLAGLTTTGLELPIGRRDEAIAIWKGLVDHQDQGLRSIAQEILSCKSREPAGAKGSTDQHRSRTGLGGRGFTEFSNMEALEQAVLQKYAAVASQPALSLLLIEAALAGGMCSPWLKDNQARTLVDLERLSEVLSCGENWKLCRNRNL